MALTVKHLNSDASFLLSFEPVCSDPTRGSVVIPQPFTILLDPWITGPSKIFHSKFSITTHKTPPCVASLSELPEPDLVIITQAKSDHCNEPTLRQLPASGTKTLILAEPASARLIKSWKYFDRNKIRTVEPYKDSRIAGKSTTIRIAVPPVTPGGPAGEVTVSWIPQKRDIAGLHGGMGITYRPPPTQYLAKPGLITPPATPIMTKIPPMLLSTVSTTDMHALPPSPPISPLSLRSVQSASTLVASSPLSPNHPAALNRCLSPSPRSPTSTISPMSQAGTRPISVLFSPHGISYNYVAPWATSHLVSEAALPLTALLHCMDSISNPWWLGGNICSGTLIGAEIARKLGARCWISAHDAEKDVRGIGTGLLKTKRWGREEILGIVGSEKDDDDDENQNQRARAWKSSSTLGLGLDTDRRIEVLRLESGEDVLVTGDGMVLASSPPKPKMSSIGEEDKENVQILPAVRQQLKEGKTLGHRRSKRLLI
ncbi:hypothetical protein BKA67DRAFT_661483 [Truncatella angustata]|uniref:Beta-lactamase superfamily domain-containing protein n=1 Tax=Truncatella angustata TaxID=152316 RepID=A0A9P8ZTD6_9PEZI|nr:uncharacterized protein BKA67DRAFT_661483 [Truncatella angustata]KAH6648516.1 hypothetical protein BKA67DRAFT_661483 [Truncatella angustata]KAH8196790.1 hypothetical protein TruAng_009032 [Truncatella angustata]